MHDQFIPDRTRRRLAGFTPGERNPFMWQNLKRIFESFLTRGAGKPLGERGELAAVNYLRRKAYQVVERNVRMEPGEIDIVAVDGRTVVFVEVKTRRSNQKGEPWEAVDLSKQEKIVGAANDYLQRENLRDQQYRYDIVSITWMDETRKPEIEHLENAFTEPQYNISCQFDS